MSFINDAVYAGPENFYIEIDKQPEANACEFQVCQDLRTTDRKDFLDRFHLYQHRIVGNYVQAISTIEGLPPYSSMAPVFASRKELPGNAARDTSSVRTLTRAIPHPGDGALRWLLPGFRKSVV